MALCVVETLKRAWVRFYIEEFHFRGLRNRCQTACLHHHVTSSQPSRDVIRAVTVWGVWLNVKYTIG